MSARPGFVYRAFDADDRLLYIGSTVDFVSRLRGHKKHSPWWPFHRYVVADRFETVPAAREAEREAIASEHPRWNVVDRSPQHPDGLIPSRCSGRFGAPWLRDEIDQWRVWLRDVGYASAPNSVA